MAYGNCLLALWERRRTLELVNKPNMINQCAGFMLVCEACVRL